MSEQTASLLRRVAGRMYANRLLRRMLWAAAIGLALAAAAILAARLTGTLPATETRWLLLGVPGVLMLGTLLLTRRPQPDRAARLVDDEAETGDLFLTTVSLDRRPDSYEPLVAAKADEQAGKLEASRLVDPFERLPVRWLVLGLLLAGAAELFTPVLDPFGQQAVAAEKERLKKQLESDKEQIELRKAELKAELEKSDDDELSPEVQAALDQFDERMAEMRPERKDRNKQELRDARRQMSKLWEQAADKLSKELMNQNAAGQQFGGEQARRHKEWKEQLKSGDAEGIQSELEQIKQLLQEAAEEQQKAQEAAEQGDEQAQAEAEQKKQDLMRQAEQRMSEMKQFAEREIGSEELSEALERAMRQMDAAQQQELTEQALQQMQESGELSEMEVEAIAQAARDMQAIQEALENLQEMNEMQGRNDGEFDASECEDCETAEDYKEFYKEQLAQREGNGNGGDRGERDEGAELPPVPEDEVVGEGFRKEVAESYLQKGEMLMSLAGKGAGSMDEEERREFKEVKRALAQEATEAIDLEDIPPGYQDRIKRYFSTLEQAEPSESAAPAPQPTPAE